MKIGLKKGFTLIELLIVIAIIGILAVALLPTILGAPAKGRDAARLAHLNALVTSIEGYNLEKGSYPPAGSSNVPVAITDTSFANVLPFIQGGKVPVDPTSCAGSTCGPKLAATAGRGAYVYGLSATTGRTYWLAAYMENAINANTVASSAAPLPTTGPLDPTLTAPAAGHTCAPFTQSTGALVNGSCLYVLFK